MVPGVTLKKWWQRFIACPHIDVKWLGIRLIKKANRLDAGQGRYIYFAAY